MRFLLFLTFIASVQGCWFYSKPHAVDKIKEELEKYDRHSVDRDLIRDIMSELPKIVSWAVEKIGVENAFKDCDANRDGTITVDEMYTTATCLDSCAKLAIVNTAL